MAKWPNRQEPGKMRPVYETMLESKTPQVSTGKLLPADPPHTVNTVYADSPSELNFLTLQQNLQSCLAIIDSEVMKDYIPTLQHCDVVPFDEGTVDQVQDIQFFRITELVYQEDEFSVHKLATVFHALSNKPCTLVLMIQSDGQTNNFYLGVRPRDSRNSAGTMRKMLEQSLLGLFPGSHTAEYRTDELKADLHRLGFYFEGQDIGCISSVSCIADYKQEKSNIGNKDFFQGLEKFIYSMQGKAFTAIFIANNLEHSDLVATRKEYEQIYTLMSPFASMQYNYSLNSSSSSSDSDTLGTSKTESTGITKGTSTTESVSDGKTQGKTLTDSITDTEGSSDTVGTGETHTTGSSDGTNDSETKTKTVGTFASVGSNSGISLGPLSVGASKNVGVSASVSRAKTHGTSHTDSVSDSISKNLTHGISSSKAIGKSTAENESDTHTVSLGTGTQYSENTGESISENVAHTKALTDTFGSSQAVTLNVQNKSLLNALERLERLLARLDECESIGMWDFAAYFLGESAAEAETAASMYQSLISGNQSGLQIAAVNTWTDEDRVNEILKYIRNFYHPVFLHQLSEGGVLRQTFVDPTVLASTNELAIQLGLPRRSVKGLPVIEHASFAQEVLNEHRQASAESVELGVVSHFGKETATDVCLDLQSLSMHTFVTGSTGAGKSNTVYQILSQLPSKGVHFLVVEPAKGEYKNVFGHRGDVSVYGTNPLIMNLLRINPFSFPKEIHIYEHLDRLVEIFNVCWPMYAAMPAIVKDAIERSYEKAGWDLRRSKNKYHDQLFPNFIDVLQQIDSVVEESQYSSDNKGDYKGALCTRLRSLTNGINSLVFTSDELAPQDLFDKNVIVDLSRVGSVETKSLIMGLMVMKLQEYRIASCKDMNVPLKHITVLEEAHNLLKRTSTEQSAESSNMMGKSVEMLTNAIAEMRTYGEGFIIADQAPGLLDMSVIRNTNTKIIMRLPEYSDRELVGRAVGLNDEQIVELSKLSKGVAAVYQNDWLEAVLCKIKKHRGEEKTYIYQPNETSPAADVKGAIISRLIAKEITKLIDHVDDTVIRANMPAAAKCRLFDYVQAPPSKKRDAASAVAYDLLCAESAFTELAKNNFDFERQKRFLLEHLTPSMTQLPEPYGQVILYYITYWYASSTESLPAKKLLSTMLDSERKGLTVR